jgi:cellulose synthase/poly-beta-1,6-N-acetylglucosamine synthase-like glycosyltransferase
MSGLLAFTLLLAAGLLLVPALVLCCEVIAAVLPAPPAALSPPTRRARVDVLVPARDEEARVARTVEALRGQLAPGDRVIVIADNCRDATAARARAAGALVIERDAPGAVGKGFALAAGVELLERDPPGVVLIVDADTRPADGLLATLAAQVQASGRPAMAAYTLAPPPEAWLGARLSAFAVRLRNLVRPRGLARLGLPCLPTGSGIALPWRLLRDAPIAHGRTAEDLALGVWLALAGSPVLFCEAARVEGALPERAEQAREQRRRWEHGHLAVLLAQAPPLLRAAWARREPALAALALDLGVPPLSLWGLLWLAAAAPAAALALLGGSVAAAALLALSGALVGAAVALAWLRFGRDLAPASAWREAPRYFAARLRSHRDFLRRRANHWPELQGRSAEPPATRAPSARRGD